MPTIVHITYPSESIGEEIIPITALETIGEDAVPINGYGCITRKNEFNFQLNTLLRELISSRISRVVSGTNQEDLELLPGISYDDIEPRLQELFKHVKGVTFTLTSKP